MSELHEPAPSDEILVARANDGDNAALAELVKRYQDKVYRLALRFAGNEQDAEDIVQDTFLQVCRRLSTFRNEARFATWLYSVASNCALMQHRSSRRHEADSLDDLLPRFSSDGLHERLDVDYSRAAEVEAVVEREELARVIRDAIGRLPPIYRVAYVLVDLEDMPANDAAVVLGIEHAAVRQRVHRARLMLRGLLGRLAGSEGP